MSFLDKNGLQVLTNKLVQGDAIKVASHRGHTVKNVIDNIQRECENISTPNTMTLENRINEFKVGKGRDVDVSGDIEEGKIEVEIKGRTFQNLLTNMQPRHGLSYRNGIYTFEASKSVHAGFNTNNMLKNNTTYSIIIEFLELPKNIENIPLFGTSEYGTTKYIHNPIVNKKYVVSATTKNTPVVDIIYLSVRPDTIRENIRFKAMLLEGDYTQTPIEELPEFFEGIKSSFEDGIVDVEVQGKNLFDGQLRTFNTNDTYIDNIGQHHNGDNNIPIKPNTSYTMTFETISGDSNIYIWNGNEKVLTIPSGKDTVSFRTPLECNSLSFYRNVEDYTKDRLKYKIQLEENSKSTPYEPYYKKKISFNIGEPLRSLPNGVCDEIRNNNGQWELIRRVEKVVVDGTDYVAHDFPPSQNSTIAFAVKQGTHSNTDNAPILNDKFINVLGDKYWNEDKECLISASDKNFKFRILRSKLETEDEAGFKKWLSQNPTTVYYELQSPIITPIEPMEFEVKPLATMTINSEIAPVSNHKVVLNRAGQIEQGIVQIAELKKRVDSLETAYDSYLLETQHKLSILGFEYELESEEI